MSIEQPVSRAIKPSSSFRAKCILKHYSFLLVAGAFCVHSTFAQCEAAPEHHPLATHLSYKMAGSGEWRTPNPEYDPVDADSPHAFGIRLQWAKGHQYVVGEVFGVMLDGRVATYQAIHVIYDPGDQHVLVQQLGWNGALARGRQQLRTATMRPGDVDRLELQVVLDSGDEQWLRHEDIVLDEYSYKSVVYERMGGDWRKTREWVWNRVPDDEATGSEAEHNVCKRSCPILEKEVIVNAPLDAVWHAWTTNEGLKFISAKSNVELQVGGPYEWFLDLPPDRNGKRGGEGAVILSFVPQQVLVFRWTFPPDIPSLRDAGETTTVVVLFDEVGKDQIQVQLHALGWQEGKDWQDGWVYFDAAWAYVLDTMKVALEQQAP